MLKVDTNSTPSKPWSKVQALTSFIQLKSGNATSSSNNKSDNHVPFVSHSNAGENEQETQEQQPKADRLKIFIGTWNMYGRLLDIDLEPFLTTRHPSSPAPTSANTTSQSDSDKKLVEHDQKNGESPFLDSSTAHPYHLLAIGTQECERDISEALFYPSKEVWEEKLSGYLADQYKMVRCETLAALHLAVFVNKKFANYVKNVHSADIKTGWANMIGNKGAVAVSLDFGSQSLLFINCHLRAHQTKLAERNANVHRILHELQIKGGKTVHGPSSSNALFHLPSLKKFTQPDSSTKSAKSINKEESSLKDKSLKNSKPSTTLNSNDPPATANTTQHVNINTADKPENETTVNDTSAKDDKSSAQGINPVQQQESGTTAPAATSSNNTPADTKNSTATIKKSSDSTSKPPKKNSKSSNKRRSVSAMSSTSSLMTSASAEEQHSVTEQFDHTFIFGDTNYRINANRQFVLDTIKKQDFETLLKYDQLTLERQQNTTPLATFNEHPINFIPTYKFDAIDAISTDSSSSAASSSSSLPIPSAATTDASNPEKHEDQKASPPLPLLSSSSSSSSSSPTPAKEMLATSSSSESFVITPKNSLHPNCGVSVRYDTSPKQRIPSWTDRILWHDRHHTHHHHHQQGIPEAIVSPSITNTTNTPLATNQPQQMKPKKNLKWIAALKRKDKNNLMENRLPDPPPVDKNTICYHYDTVMDPRLMGVSDHLPVIGIFGVWFDDWEHGSSKQAKSIKSFKKKVPLWKKWLL